jgi:hypothetical protein
VTEERRLRGDNQAYDNFAYHHSVIGSMEDLDAANVDDVKQAFKSTTRPTTPCSPWSANAQDRAAPRHHQ